MASDPRTKIGERGERAAAKYLKSQGLRPIERNFRSRCGELDLVAIDRQQLVFCEVKTRTVHDQHSRAQATFHPFLSVGLAKQRRIRRMAELWLTGRSHKHQPLPPNYRFDVVGVTLDSRGRVLKIEHLPNAFYVD